VVGRIDLADAGAAAFTRDLAAYSAVTSTDIPATRLQYVVRWEYAGDNWYLAAETDSAGKLSFYGGKVDSSSAVSNVNAAVAIAYRPQTAFPVTGEIQGNTLLLRGRMADFGVVPGSTLISYQAFSLAGPADALLAGAPQTSQIFATMRDVDGAPAMDAVIAGPEQQPLVPIPGGPAQPVALAGSPNTAAAPAGTGLASLAALGLLGLLGAGVRRRRRSNAR
jgi:MYXO-CTERM domain-containing protein